MGDKKIMMKKIIFVLLSFFLVYCSDVDVKQQSLSVDQPKEAIEEVFQSTKKRTLRLRHYCINHHEVISQPELGWRCYESNERAKYSITLKKLPELESLKISSKPRLMNKNYTVMGRKIIFDVTPPQGTVLTIRYYVFEESESSKEDLGLSEEASGSSE